MFWRIFLFEIKYRLSRPATYIYFGLFLALSILMLTVEGISIGMIPATANKNAPFVFAIISAVFTAFGMLVTSAMMSTPIIRDYDHDTHHFIYSMPITKWQYLGGRFLGSLVMTVLVFLSIPIGLMIGSSAAQLFGLHDGKLGPFMLWSFIQPFLIIAIPNIIFAGTIFFALASLTKKMVYSYLGNVILLIGYIMATNLLSDFENLKLASLLDPFGLISLSQMARYWTLIEYNTHFVSLDFYLILNRVIWMAIGFIILAISYRKFSFTVPKVRAKKSSNSAIANERGPLLTLPRLAQNFKQATYVKLMLKQAWLYFKGTVSEIAFIAIVLSGIGLVVSGAISTGSMYSTDFYPVTYSLIESVGASFTLFIIIILTFFSGELVWKERSVKLNQIYDTLPVPSWATFASKYLAMLLVTILLLAIIMVTCIAVQISRSYFIFDLSQYVSSLFVLSFTRYAILLALIMFIQTIAPNKFVGFVFVMAYYMINGILNSIGLEDGLLRPNAIPGYTYSDMNGYGTFLTPILWFSIYWGAFGGMIWLLSNLFWNRGTETGSKNAWKRAKARFQSKTIRMAFAALGIIFIGSGAYVFYNTHIVNKFETSTHKEKMAANFEKKYKYIEKKIQPKIVDANVTVDIFPYDRSMNIAGTIFLKNISKSAIDSVFINLPTSGLNLETFTLDGNKVNAVDEYYGMFVSKLIKPLHPGDSIPLVFKYTYTEKGFANSGNTPTIAENGTFVNSKQVFPQIGYADYQELEDKDKRKKYELPIKKRMASITDSTMYENTYLGNDGGWIRFKTTVSTSDDQVAIAPGNLVKEWKQNNRNYYTYSLDTKIMNFYSFLSAKYEVKREKYKGIALEVYYHKGHEFNLPNMFKAMRASLDYYQANFSPFQHKYLRIVEFPRYATFAQSFPGTIPYSENIGFIADLRDSSEIDYVYYVTAHEIAHQWWAHQVCGANVQGATLMSESLSQYSALMVMEKEYGKTKMRKFLKYELDRYLSARKYEKEKENPLYLNENQGYIHYNKGSVAMYSLRDYIGEANLNKALAKYTADWAFKEPPFSISTQFLPYLNEVTPDSLKYLISDLYKTITLYSNKAQKATVESMPNGKFKVVLTVDSEKLQLDSTGLEKPIKFADYIDIGVMAKNGKDDKVLYLQKHKVKPGENRFEIVVNSKPEIAGIDPMNKLIDRDSDDNRVKVETL